MRDVSRIDKFLDELEDIWKTHCPDWRFGQMISNVLNTFDIDPFFIEEEEMIKRIRNFFDKGDANVKDNIR